MRLFLIFAIVFLTILYFNDSKAEEENDFDMTRIIKGIRTGAKKSHVGFFKPSKKASLKRIVRRKKRRKKKENSEEKKRQQRCELCNFVFFTV